MLKKFLTKIRKGRKSRLIGIIALIAIVAPLAVNTLLNSIANQVKADSFFKLDEGYGTSGAVKDSNNAVSAGSITGATWKTDDMCFDGKCLYFDGDGDFVSFADDADLDFTGSNSFTISLWFRHAPITTGTQVLIAKANASAGYKIWMESDGDITFATDDDATWTTPDDSAISTAATYDDNSWHHISAVKSGTTSLTLYIDGVKVAEDAVNGQNTLENSASFYIGIDGDGSSNDYKGFIDEVKVYRSAKTETEIKGDYVSNSTLGGTSASFGPSLSYLSEGLVGYWKMDESSGNATDYSGLGNTLTNYNTTTYTAGKFGNGSEHVPASSQYFSSATGGSNEYYFNASDESMTSSKWVSFGGGAYDSDIDTAANTEEYLECSSLEGNYITAGGTNTPTSGENISSVEARFRGYALGDGSSIYTIIYTNGAAEQLYNQPLSTLDTNLTWADYSNLSTPTGGWTWQKLNDLETRTEIIGEGGWQMACTGGLSYIQLRVTTASSNPGNVNSATFWVNPDNTTNYYLSLNSSAYITSTSGLLSATGFTNPKIYVNGVQTTAISANTWQMVTITSDTAITADQFYIGRVGSNYFDGTMDEVRLYNRILSPSEVTGLYNWAPGPVGYWKLDDSTGTSASDSSGNSYTGTLANGAKWTDGMFGGAASFDGGAGPNDDVITVGDQTAYELTTFTVGGWVYRTGTCPYSTCPIFSKGMTGNIGYSLSLADSSGYKARIDIRDSLQQVTGTTALATNTWYHVAATIDGTTVRLYVNGVLDAEASQTQVPTFSTEEGKIGNRQSANDITFNGKIDDVKIYNYVRTPSQIIEDMNAGHPAPGSPVGSAYIEYEFDEGYSTTANNTGNGGSTLNGTITSGTWTNSGKFDKAITLSASSSVSDTISDPGYNNSISIWVYPTTSAASKTLVTASKLTTDSSSRPVYGGCTGTALSLSTWTHILAVSNGSTSCAIYQDGKLTSSGATGVTFGTSLNIGASSFTGSVDKFKLYTSALTAEQAKMEFNQGQMAVMGSLSTDSSVNPSWSAINSYCPPGQTSTCVAPIAEWKLDEGNWINDDSTRTIWDSSGNGYDLRSGPSGTGPTGGQPGKFGKSGYFDGVNDFIQEPTNADLSIDSEDFTISAWLNKATPASTDVVLAKKATTTATDPGYYISISSAGAPRFYMSDGTDQFTLSAASSIPINQWVHLLVTVDRDTATNTDFYVNGIKTGSTQAGTITNVGNLNPVTAQDLTIGAQPAGNTNYEGYIDHVKIFRYAMTPAQIAWDYNQGAPQAWWKFDECSGSTAYDHSGNSYNLTMTTGTGGGNTSLGSCNSGVTTEAWNNGTDGRLNASFDFDGSNTAGQRDYGERLMSDFLSTASSGTITVWLKPDTFSTWASATWGCIICSGDNASTNRYLGLGINPTNHTVVFGQQNADTETDIASVDTIPEGEWTHIAMWSDGSTYKMYLNGKQVRITTASGTNNGDWFSDTTARDNIVVGGLGWNSTYSFMAKGQIDEVKVFNYPLTEKQIQLDYNLGSALRFE